MFKTTFLIRMFMAAELTNYSSGCFSQPFDEQTDSTNCNINMPIQQSYSASNVTNTESNTYLLSSIEKQIWMPRKNITMFVNVSASNYTFFLYDSINFIEDNYFFDCFIVCNVILKIGLSNRFCVINICNHPEFKNSFNIFLIKYLHDTELLINKDSISETVHLTDSFSEFVTNFNSRSELFGAINRDQLRTYLKLNLARLGIKYDCEEEENIYILKITELLYSNTFQILNILFPEIKLVYELILKKDYSKCNLKKFHLFITYIAFKIKINETILKDRLIICDIYGDKSFTNSTLILSFIYNVRLDFTIMSFNLSLKKEKLNFLIALTYLSFLRLKYPRLLIENDLNEFIILEMSDLENISSFVSERYSIEIIKEEKSHIQLKEFFLRYELKENTQEGLCGGLLSKENAVSNSEFVTSKISNQPDSKSVIEFATFRPFSELKKYFGL